MTPRQRVRAVLDGKMPDRVPIDLGSSTASGIMTIGYNKLRADLGINGSLAKQYRNVMQLAWVEKEVIDKFHIDVIDAGQNFLKSDDDWKEWTLNNGSKCLIPKYVPIKRDKDGTVYMYNKDYSKIIGKQPRTSLYVDQVYWPYGELDAIPREFKDKDLVEFTWAVSTQPPWNLNIFDDEQYKLFCDGIKELYETTDLSIMLVVGSSLFEYISFLRGMENFFMDVVSDKKGVHRLVEKLTENNIAFLDKILKGVGQYVDSMEFGDDLGWMKGPLVSPDIYRELFKNYHKKANDFVHDNSNTKIFLHCCGSIYELIPDLIEANFDILNPIQTTAKDMEPEKLKKEFGKDIIFWGGCCDVRKVLPLGTPKDVEEDVKRKMAILGEGGGLVFAPEHNIMADVPPKNVIAMMEAAYKYGKY
jgi:uroporphyrinogen decarboxylase